MKITLNIPSSNLSPNRKNGKHWAHSHAAKKEARDGAYLATMAESNCVKLVTPPDTLKITFVLPTKRARDLDNLLSSAKSSIDGMCLALGIDDECFVNVILKKEHSPGVSKMIFEV